MALPTAYLTSTKNLDGILTAIQTAQAPNRFTLSFLEQLGYKSSSDRLVINVLKAIGFLSSDGSPTERYYRFLDPAEAPRVLAEGLRAGYADLFQLNRNAQNLSRVDVKNKIKTLTQGQANDNVAGRMATTFLELAKRADFSEPPNERTTNDSDQSVHAQEQEQALPPSPNGGSPSPNVLGGLVYSIQIHLPESRDQAVYDALFRSLKNHLL